MKIGVLGSGDVGRVLGAGGLKHGHDLMLGTRDPKKKEVHDWMRATPGAKAGTFEEAAQFAEIVVLAALGRAVETSSTWLGRQISKVRRSSMQPIPYDCGSIMSARAIEPLCMLWCLPGFLRNDWRHAFKMLTT